MVILAAVSIMAGALMLAYLLSNGLPESMRRLALWLLVSAAKLDASRERRDAAVRAALAEVR